MPGVNKSKFNCHYLFNLNLIGIWLSLEINWELLVEGKIEKIYTTALVIILSILPNDNSYLIMIKSPIHDMKNWKNVLYLKKNRGYYIQNKHLYVWINNPFTCWNISFISEHKKLLHNIYPTI